jgi:hypothetical protein
VTVEPPLVAIANDPLAAPPPAQPPRAHATTNSAATTIARGVLRQQAGMTSLITSCDIVKMH